MGKWLPTAFINTPLSEKFEFEEIPQIKNVLEVSGVNKWSKASIIGKIAGLSSVKVTNLCNNWNCSRLCKPHEKMLKCTGCDMILLESSSQKLYHIGLFVKDVSSEDLILLSLRNRHNDEVFELRKESLNLI